VAEVLTARTIRRCSDPKLIGCRQDAEPRTQRCHECWLRAQPPIVRADAAKRRLELVPERWRFSTVNKRDWPEGRRWCAGCQTFVLLIDASGSRCKACASAASHRTAVARRFGIDEETYGWLLEQQHGRCAICRTLPRSQRMAVDHDHACTVCGGKDGCPACVRGLLCARCNHELLGAAHDSVNILWNAVNYLTTPPMSGEWRISEFEKAQLVERYGPGAGDDPPPY
jgi:hypothetical protein